MVTPDGGFYFPAVDFLAETIQKAAFSEGRGMEPVFIDCSKFIGSDYSVAKVA